MAIITKPVTEPDDIQSVLGISTTNYGTIMRPDLFGYSTTIINKMSKKKPLSRNILHSLTDEQFKSGVNGASGTNGIFWGLRIATSAYNWTTIHNATWEYEEKPTGGIDSSPYRPSDFVGYDSNAKPAIIGIADQLTSSNAEILYNNTQGLFTCQLTDQSSGNTTGVSQLDALGISLSNAYLCAAIDNYAVAMLNGRAGDTVAPLSSGAKEFTCPPLPSNHPLRAAATSRKVTLFIANLDSVTSLKTKGNWIALTSSSMGVKAASIPELAGLSVKFSEASTLGFGSWTLVSTTTSGTMLNATARCDVAPTFVTNPTVYGYKVTLQFNNINGTTKTFSRTLTSSSVNINLMNALLTWTASEMGLKPTSGTTYSYTLRLYGVSYSANGSTLTREDFLSSLTGSFTYTGSTIS